MPRFSLAACGFVLVAGATGCGGGGGSTPPTAAVPTFAPTTGPVAPAAGSQVPKGTLGLCTALNPVQAAPGAANPSTYTVQSIPSGLAVNVSGGTTASGVTPTTVTAGVSSAATTFTVMPNDGAQPFSFVCDQRANGNRTLLYNQLADTNGSIGAISASSVARHLDLSRASQAAAVMPRFVSHGALGRRAFSTTRLVVRYRSVATGARPMALERALGVSRGVEIGPADVAVRTRVVDVPSGSSIEALAARFRAEPDVRSATPDRLYYTESTTPVTPTDKHFDDYQQWSEFEIKTPNAWAYTTGSPTISIATIDTGADFNHPDLQGKIVYSESVLNGTTTVGPASAQDTNGHGTNVAGIAAADTNNGIGYAGTGYNSSLQVYKVFSNGTAANKYSTTANSSDVTQAIYDAQMHGAKVINLSLGTCEGGGADPMQRDAVDYVIARGVSVVAAAGNERSGSTDATCAGSATVDFPAAYDGVIAVGASALDDTAAPTIFAAATEKVASYSNVGPGLSLVAPGGDPTSADTAAGSTTTDLLHWIAGLYTTTPANPTATCKTPSDCQALFAGTSQATPHVSGTIALMLALNPNLTPAQIKTTLMANADDIGDPNEGAGRLDAYRALAAVKGDPAPPAPPTDANFVAFAYVPNGTTTPQIIDVTYPTGIPVAPSGAFRVVDIPATASGYKIGVWYDANGDGRIDAGDYFGASGTCSSNATCASAAGIVVHPVSSGFVP